MTIHNCKRGRIKPIFMRRGRGINGRWNKKTVALLDWLNGKGQIAIGAAASRNQNGVERMIWRLFSNAHNQGRKLIAYILETRPSRRLFHHKGWGDRAVDCFGYREKVKGARRLTDKELAVLFFRTEGAVKEEHALLYPIREGIFCDEDLKSAPMPKVIKRTTIIEEFEP